MDPDDPYEVSFMVGQESHVIEQEHIVPLENDKASSIVIGGITGGIIGVVGFSITNIVGICTLFGGTIIGGYIGYVKKNNEC